jgi:putative nucleotidyltransferase with HDIG domain
MSRRARITHLAGRFFGSLHAREVDDADVACVRRVLTPDELAVWETLGRADRAESVAVAHRVAHALGPDAEDRWVAAALLHDVGKTDAHLGTIGRAGAAAVAGVAGHGRARRWTNRVGAYITHDDRGAARLEAAGARPEAVAWARAHHRPELWPGTGIPPDLCEVLAVADGEPAPEK